MDALCFSASALLREEIFSKGFKQIPKEMKAASVRGCLDFTRWAAIRIFSPTISKHRNTGSFIDANMEAGTTFIRISTCGKSSWLKMRVQLQVEMEMPHLFRDNIDSGTSKPKRGGSRQ